MSSSLSAKRGQHYAAGGVKNHICLHSTTPAIIVILIFFLKKKKKPLERWHKLKNQ